MQAALAVLQSKTCHHFFQFSCWDKKKTNCECSCS